MTSASADVHRHLPRSDRTPYPKRYLLHSLRPLSRWLIRRHYAVTVHHAERVPKRDAVIFAANHIGVIDGPLLAIFAPRPVHALTKIEMFTGRTGGFLRHAGQIPLDRWRTDPAAIKACVRVLRDGGAVGIFPEGRRGDGELRRFHRGAAYLALSTGAPIVPVSIFGTREPGAGSETLPPKRSSLDLVIGTPIQFDAQPWPRTRNDVAAATAELRTQMRAQLDVARHQLGRSLPGPLPVGDVEPDPAVETTATDIMGLDAPTSVSSEGGAAERGES